MTTVKDILEQKTVTSYSDHSWKGVLKNIVMPPSHVFPAAKKEQPDTEIMLDTSGGVSFELTREFLLQTLRVLKGSEIKVGCFDHELHPFGVDKKGKPKYFKEIKTAQDFRDFPLEGGGGTDFDCPVKAFTKNKSVNKIIFTDGEAPVPQVPTNPKDREALGNVIWVQYSDVKGNFASFKPPFGKVIRVEREDILPSRDLFANRGDKGSR